MNPSPSRIIATPFTPPSTSKFILDQPTSPHLARITHIGASVAQYHIGDIVLYSNKYDSTKEEVTLDNVTYIFLTEQDILTTMDK